MGGGSPSKEMVDDYLHGSGKLKPLDPYNFPRLIRDMSWYKQKTIGSPMYGPSGVIRGIMVLAASCCDNAEEITRHLGTEQSFVISDLLRAAYRGEAPEQLLDIMNEGIQLDLY